MTLTEYFACLICFALRKMREDSEPDKPYKSAYEWFFASDSKEYKIRTLQMIHDERHLYGLQISGVVYQFPTILRDLHKFADSEDWKTSKEAAALLDTDILDTGFQELCRLLELDKAKRS